jgi:hypothetical protein
MVVTARDEEWLLIVKEDTPNGSLVFIKFFDESTDPVILQLN